jgi:hypothetical protein
MASAWLFVASIWADSRRSANAGTFPAAGWPRPRGLYIREGSSACAGWRREASLNSRSICEIPWVARAVFNCRIECNPARFYWENFVGPRTIKPLVIFRRDAARRAPLDIDDLVPDREMNQAAETVKIEFPHEVGAMRVHGFDADVEGVGYLFMASSLSQQLQDFELSRG